MPAGTTTTATTTIITRLIIGFILILINLVSTTTTATTTSLQGGRQTIATGDTTTNTDFQYGVGDLTAKNLVAGSSIINNNISSGSASEGGNSNNSSNSNSTIPHDPSIRGNASSTTTMSVSRIADENPRMVNGVVVLLLMVLNLAGNSLVLYIYHSLFKKTVFCLFVQALAGLDLLTALTTMLMDVLMKLRPNHESVLHTVAMCKLSHFQVYANSMASGCILILIAFQRYRKICHPLQRGIQPRQARLLLAVIGAVCLVLATPTLFLYGVSHVKVMVRSTVVTATICRADEGFLDTPLHMAFYYLLMVAFCLVLGSTCLFYCLVSRAIRKFEMRNSVLFANTPVATSPVLATVNENDDDEESQSQQQYNRGGHFFNNNNHHHHQHQNQPSPVTGRTLATSPVHGRPVIINDPFRARQPLSPSSPGANQRPPSFPRSPAAAGAKSSRDRFSQARMSTFSMASSSTNVISAQMYRVFTIITVVYIISYLPHLVALVLTRVLSLDQRVLSYGQRMALEFAYNCPYISTVSNPLIYGFSSGEFRDKVKEFLQSWDCCGCCGCCFECDDDGVGCECRNYNCCLCRDDDSDDSSIHGGGRRRRPY